MCIYNYLTMNDSTTLNNFKDYIVSNYIIIK